MRRATLTVCILAIAACEIPMDIELCPETSPAGRIAMRIGGGRETVFVGDTVRLVAEVSRMGGVRYSCEFCCPSGGGVIETPIEWSSSNSRVATVSTTGVVVGREAGGATITARAPSLGVSAHREIVVVAGSP